MKKIKKHVRLVYTSRLDMSFCSDKFVDSYGNASYLVKSTHTTLSVVSGAAYLGYNPSRLFIRRFWAPIKIMYRYTGKSYRVRVKQNAIFLRFNKAHKSYLFHMGNKLEYFKNKGFRLRFWKTTREIFYFNRILRLMRPRNRFTSRGIWKKKTFYLKKKGKVSGYR